MCAGIGAGCACSFSGGIGRGGSLMCGMGMSRGRGGIVGSEGDGAGEIGFFFGVGGGEIYEMGWRHEVDFL